MSFDTASLIRNVRRVEIKTKKLSDQVFGGEYHSAFKGKGMTFSEVRKYEYGDDVRSIDWNVSARQNEPYIKIYEEEREEILMLVVDISGSVLFGTQLQTKLDKAIEVAAALAFSALQNNDKVGLMAFSNSILKYVPPKKGRSNVLRILSDLIVLKQEADLYPPRKTNINSVFERLTISLKKKANLFIFSDFLDEGYQKKLQILAKKHDVNGFRIYDNKELNIPQLGSVYMNPLESNKPIYLNTLSSSLKQQYRAELLQQINYFETSFKRANADFISCELNEDHFNKLHELFRSKTN